MSAAIDTAPPRYYVDRRDAASALRDRTEGDAGSTFGPLAPGVLVFVKGEIDDFGKVVVNDKHLDTIASDANRNERTAVAFLDARRTAQQGERDKARRLADESRRRDAFVQWMHDFEKEAKQAVAGLLRDGEFVDTEGHGTERVVYIECGPLFGSKWSQNESKHEERLVKVSLSLWHCRVSWELVVDGRCGHIPLLLGFFDRLASIFDALAVVAERFKTTRAAAPYGGA